MHTCPTCKGSKKINVEVHEQKKPVQHVELPCHVCLGAGTMTDRQMKDHQRMLEAWCQCGSSSDRWRYNGYGGECMDCGGLTSVG